MPRKRTGHVEPRGGKWMARVGREYLGVFDSEADANAAVAFKLQHEKHRHKDGFDVRGEAYMQQQEQLTRARRGKARGFRGRWSLWRCHIRTAPFYRMRVKDIKRSHIQAHINALASKPAVWRRADGKLIGPTGRTLGRPTLEHVRSRLTHFFNSCAELDVNPAERVVIPNVGKVERRKDSDHKPHLHADEIDRLFALDMKPWHRAVYHLGIYAGLRGGEIFGLTWHDVRRLDSAEPELHVRASWDSDTKTMSSQREIPMLPQLAAAMRSYRDSLGATPIAGPVFPNADGKVRSPGSKPAGWYDVKRVRNGKPDPTTLGYRTRAGVREHIQFRHLRHTCATHLLAGTFTGGYEWPIEKVSELLGHESVLITIKHYASRGVGRLHVEVRKGLAATGSEKPNEKPTSLLTLHPDTRNR